MGKLATNMAPSRIPGISALNAGSLVTGATVAEPSGIDVAPTCQVGAIPSTHADGLGSVVRNETARRKEEGRLKVRKRAGLHRSLSRTMFGSAVRKRANGEKRYRCDAHQLLRYGIEHLQWCHHVISSV